jgi:hypothetical protein
MNQHWCIIINWSYNLLNCLSFYIMVVYAGISSMMSHCIPMSLNAPVCYDRFLDFVFMPLIFSRRTSEIFCGTSLYWNFPGVLCLWEEDHSHHFKIHSITMDYHSRCWLSHLALVLFVRYPCCKLTLFSPFLLYLS